MFRKCTSPTVGAGNKLLQVSYVLLIFYTREVYSVTKHVKCFNVKKLCTDMHKMIVRSESCCENGYKDAKINILKMASVDR